MADYSHQFPLLNGESTRYETLSLGLLGPATATALGTIALPMAAGTFYKDIRFKIAGLTSETVSFTGATDGNTANVSAALSPIDASTGQPVTSTNLGNGTYIIPRRWQYYSFVFTKSSNSETAAVALAATVAPK